MSDQQTSSEDLMVKWYVEITPPTEQEGAAATEGAPSGESTQKYKSNGKFTPYSCEPRTITVPSKNSRLVDLLPDDSTNQAPDVDLLFIKSDINYNECKFIDKLYFIVGSAQTSSNAGLPGDTSSSTEKDQGQHQHPGHGQQTQYPANPQEPGTGNYPPPTQTPTGGYPPPTQTPTGGGGTGGTARRIYMNNDIFLVGASLISLLGADVRKLTFYNELPRDVKITYFVCY
jgi:hypothetical protein